MSEQSHVPHEYDFRGMSDEELQPLIEELQLKMRVLNGIYNAVMIQKSRNYAERLGR